MKYLALLGLPPKVSFRIIGFIIILGITQLFTRVDNKLVVFASDAHATPVGNMKAVRDNLLSRKLSIRVEDSMRANLATRRTWRQKFELVRLLATAKVLVLDDYFPEAYVVKRPRGTQMIQLWHAGGAFKKVGFSRDSETGGPGRRSLAHRGYTKVVVSSPSIAKDYALSFKANLESVVATGIPKTDPLFDKGYVKKLAQSVRDKYSIPAGNRIVLFAPTFRGTHQHEAHYDEDWLDWQKFAGRPEFANTTFLVKHHPFLRKFHNLVPSGVDNVINVTADKDMTAFLCAADVLITDYSSSIFEFSLLEKPIVFYCPDLEDYIGDRGFYYPLEEYLCGPIAHDQDELAEALADKKPSLDKVRELRHKFMDACDGHATERVVNELILPALDLN